MKQFAVGSIIGVVALVSSLSLAGSALAQDAAFGRGVWLKQAPCAECHGWMGDGNSADPRQPRGANLRETQLDADAIIEIIMCGIPGSAMPHFDPKAYTDDRCYGQTAADLGDQVPEMGSAPLTKRHAAGLAAFILETFAGKGPATSKDCLDLLGAESQLCATLPN